LKNNAGSDCFFSPEACAGEKYSGKTADIWACAITLYQIVFAKLPFNSVNRIGLYE
jgi:serine/threonine protein kinase